MAQRISKIDTRSQRTAYRWTALLMGLPFVGFGAFFALMGFGVIGVVGKANAPPWVVGYVGLAFGFAGLWLVVAGARGVLNQARARQARLQQGDRPWFADHDWEPDGIRDSAFGRVVGAIFGGLLFVAFLAPFNWWAFLSSDSNWLVVTVTVFFDLVVVGVALYTGYLILRFLRYGHSQLRFGRFPFFLGERVEVTFRPNRFDALRCTLRFVEERFETSGSGESRSTRLVSYEHYREERELRPGRLAPEVELVFDLPDNPEWETALSGQPVRYWELLVEAEVPGVDFRTTFPLPVYAREGRSARQSGMLTAQPSA